MMHLAIHTTVVPSPSDEISCEIFSGNMQKKKNRKISTKRKEMESKGRKNIIKEKDETTKEEWVIYIYIKIGITINLKHLSKEYSQPLVVLLQKNARKYFFLPIEF